MIIKTLTVGILASNCYIVGCPVSGEGVVIDPGAGATKIMREIETLRIKVKAIINTHGHYDHVGGNGRIKEATGAPVLLNEKDLDLYKNPGYGLSLILKAPPLPDRLISEEEVIPFGNLRLKVIETPGHTSGGISLLLESEKRAIFTGDTLFNLSIGRTDMPGGSYTEIIRSIKKKIMVFPNDTIIYPGHGPSSTIGQERKANPFLR